MIRCVKVQNTISESIRIMLAKLFSPFFFILLLQSHSVHSMEIEAAEELSSEGFIHVTHNTINAVDEDGLTALHRAALSDNKKLLQGLLLKGANINAVDNNGNTALHCIIKIKHDEKDYSSTVMFLIKEGIEVNAVDFLGRTALHYVVMNGHSAEVALLLEKRAAVNVVDFVGRTPLHYASVGKNGLVFFLLVDGEDFNVGDFETLNLYREYQYCPLYRGTFPQTVKLLSDAGFQINVSLDEKPYHSVVVIMEKPLSGGDLSGIVNTLIKSDAFLNVQDIFGRSPLALATQSRFSEAAQILIAQGADVNIQDGDGLTPMHGICLCREGFWGDKYNDFLRLFYDNGCDLTLMDSRGMTPLHHCVDNAFRFASPHSLVVQLLLYGADVNSRDFADCTPLHYLGLTSFDGSKKYPANVLKRDAKAKTIAKVLINGGADIAVRCKNDCIHRQSMRELLQLFQCCFCAFPLLEDKGNVLPITDICSHKIHLACLEGLKGDPGFKGACPVCQSPLKKEMVEECFYCFEEFCVGEDNGMLIGKNCTHRIHAACREQFFASKAYKGVCPLCIAAIN